MELRRSRFRTRLPLVALCGVVFGSGIFATAMSCSTDAIGVDACRQIEDARCEASRSCQMTSDQVASCKLFYWDQCLHGIENAASEPAVADITACVGAIQQAAICAADGVTAMSACTKAPLTVDAGGDQLTPCEAIEHVPESMQACFFIVAPVEAGVPDVVVYDAPDSPFFF